MKKKTATVALWLLFSMFALVACTPPKWFNTAEALANIGATSMQEIVSVADPALATQAQKVEQDFQAVENAINDFIKQPTDTALQTVQAVFNTLVQDEDSLLAAFNVSNQHTDTVIKAVLAIVDSAVNQIANLIPTSASPALSASARARVDKVHAAHLKLLTAKDLKKDFNRAVKGDKRFKPLKLSLRELL
jgi:hypothetical protein